MMVYLEVGVGLDAVKDKRSLMSSSNGGLE